MGPTLLVAVAFALDLASAAPSPSSLPSERDLELVPVALDGVLAARLVNRANHPLRVIVRDACAQPLSAELDGAQLPFSALRCSGEAEPEVRTLAPGESTLAISFSIALDRPERRAVTLTYSVARPSDPAAHWFGTIRGKPLVPVIVDESDAGARREKALWVIQRRVYDGPGRQPFPMERDLELVPVDEAGALGARLTNRSDHPLRILLGDPCNAASPMSAELDGARVPFSTGAPCAGKSRLLVRTLQPRESRTLVTSAIRADGRAVAVFYSVGRPSDPTAYWFGTIRSKRMVPLKRDGGDVAKLLRITVRTDGNDLVAEHVVVPGTPARRWFLGWIGACPSSSTRLLVDGAVSDEWPTAPRVCDGPVLPEVKVLAGGDRFTVRGPLPPTARGRVVRARYAVSADDVTSLRGDPPITLGSVDSDGSRAP